MSHYNQDISQHSHEIGMANLPYTRRGRKAAVQQEKERGRKSVVTSDAEHQAASSNGPLSIPIGTQPSPNHSVSSFSSAVSMLAPLPGQPFPQPQTASVPQPYGYPNPTAYTTHLHPQPTLPHERWDNMATLFQTIREHARVFEYPPASVAALETIVIRLYLESPMGVTWPNGRPPPTHMHTPTPNHQNNMNGSVNDGGSTSTAEDTS